MFGGHSYIHMTTFLDGKLKKYKEFKPNLSRKRINKIKEVNIQDIEQIDCTVGDVPARLYKISAYNTNLIDGYVETEKKVKLTKNDKLGSETNFMLIYPIIIGINQETYQYQWKILLYEDPTKDNNELVAICKTVLEKVFLIKVANIKLDRVLKLLKEKKIVSELSLQFNSQTYDENEIDTSLKEYLVLTSLKKIKYEKFKNIPFEEIETLINDKDYEQEFQKRTIKMFFQKKEIKLTNELIEAKNKIKETVEEIFNSDVSISESEIDNLFETDYIIEKMAEIIHEYLSEDN
jgi:Fe2+ or Zn2+ uptake regulation protein